MNKNNERDKKNIEVWTKAINNNVMLYPSERVAQFMGRKYQDRERNIGKNAIDIGFGSGRHVKILLDYGFDTYGIDYVKDCIDTATNLFSGQKNLKDLILGDIGTYDFKDLKFDLILSFGVIFLRTEEEIITDLKNINRIANTDSRIFFSFRTKDASFYGKGEQVAENTFILDVPNYEGATYTFLDKEDVEKILTQTGFKIDYIEREDYWKNNLSEHHSWWLISALKA